MTAELTSEDIVTSLLTSNEIIKQQRGNFYISNPELDTLGDFLLDLDIEYTKSPAVVKTGDLRFRFIKSNSESY